MIIYEVKFANEKLKGLTAEMEASRFHTSKNLGIPVLLVSSAGLFIVPLYCTTANKPNLSSGILRIFFNCASFSRINT